MRALSVKEPWASLIIHGGKDTENRTWPAEFTGPLLIVASGMPDVLASIGWDRCLFEAANRRAIGLPSEHLWRIVDTKHKSKLLTLGHALGVVDVVGCDQDTRSKWDEPEQWHWRLANPRPLVIPFPVKGRLGVYQVEDRLVQIAGGIAA